MLAFPHPHMLAVGSSDAGLDTAWESGWERGGIPGLVGASLTFPLLKAVYSNSYSRWTFGLWCTCRVLRLGYAVASRLVLLGDSSVRHLAALTTTGPHDWSWKLLLPGGSELYSGR